MSEFTLQQLDSKTKLVIWDLDETFWEGTLSEEDIEVIQQNVDIVKKLSDRGIMSSICSKNDFDEAKAKLEEIGIWEYFIFPKIQWGPKGELVETILEQAQLRGENTVFIDDNHMNLEEVEYYNPDVTVVTPDQASEMLSNPHFEGKDDTDHSRLEHYKILEEKTDDKQEFSSNERFLHQSDIQASIITDCEPHLDRITELVNRTNQLNFTKRRQDKAEIRTLIEDDTVETACIRVTDSYGDYGIVGFYALDESGELLHFLFSCRLIDLQIEQWTYAKLGYPELEVQGETASELDQSFPAWITEAQPESTRSQTSDEDVVQCFIKGGCDLQQLSHYLEFYEIEMETEFNYASFHREHSEILKASQQLSDEQQQALVDSFPFYDEKTFETQIFDSSNDVVIYSVLMDYTHPIFRSRDDPELTIAWGDFEIPITEEEHWDTLLERIDNSSCDREFIETFAAQYENEGPLTPEQFTANLEWFRNALPDDTLLILLNGSEVPVENELEPDRHERHTEMNAALDQFVESTENTRVVDVRQYVDDESEHREHIRHYSRENYRNFAIDAKEIIEAELDVTFEDSKLDSIRRKVSWAANDAKSQVGSLLNQLD
jgi:FkbH-like protein